MWCLLLAVAQAGTVPAWSIDDFGEDGFIAGNGWTAGYTAESWYVFDGYLLDVGDDAIEDNGFNDDGSDFPGYGVGTAADNWLVRGEDLAQQTVSMSFFNDDEDTFGLVTNLSAPDTFYMVAHTENSAPPPIGEVDRDILFLLKVEGGEGSLVAVEPVGLDGDSNRLIVTINDTSIRVTLNGETAIEETLDALLPAGQAGVFSYNNGYEGSDASAGWIESLSVSWIDEDDDGVADDTDNCEKTANEDQLDSDEDGLGDLCDDDPFGDPGGGDTGTTGDTGGGSDSGLPNGDSGLDGDGSGDTVLEGAGCGCASGPTRTHLGWLLLGLAGLALRRRD